MLLWRWLIQLVDVTTGEGYQVVSKKSFPDPVEASEECRQLVFDGGLYRMGVPLGCGIVDAEIYAQIGERDG